MKRIIAALLVLCFAVCLCACGGSEEATSTPDTSKEESKAAESSEAIEAESSEEEQKASYTVTVVDQNGDPVANAMVQLCKESCFPGKSDADGKISFAIEDIEGYKLQVLSCPEGYTYEGEGNVYLETGSTEFTLELKKGE